ncbi:MAG: 5-formyltetrahydrofolate cyclo-ligase [Prevotella sp.]|jgi:5-formyltetrahydrofolate cyclo-ligase|nr:5-formyltetrahydrofolate cyclo-ligase [Prevotella sp.]
MNKIQQQKDKLRAQIKSIKGQHSLEDLALRSQEVLSVLEITGFFQDAKKIFIYNSLADEVQTIDFIHKWKDEKEFFLPVIKGDNIVFRKYIPNGELKQSSFGIQEPIGDDFTDYNKIDLIIVPGVAFDRKKNRLGRGKGYYDRFLKNLKMPKAGICFEFQLLDQLPVDQYDIPMDYIVSENDLIW